MAHLILLGRSKEILSSARFLHDERPDDISGVAGLAHQAVDLAMKVLATEIDGTDAGGHRARMRRTQQIVQTKDRQLSFLWDVRQRDFYGDTRPGGALDLPTGDQIAKALNVDRDIIDRIDEQLHRPPDEVASP